MKASLPILLVLSLAACAAPAPPAAGVSPGRSDVLGALAGSWTGVLEYADYRSDRRVQLPMRLTAVPQDGGRALDLRYVFREPNGDTVTSSGMHRVDLPAGRYVMDEDTFAISAITGFGAGGGGGRMVLTGTVIDNDRPEPARYTYVLAGDSLRVTKETRSPWQFRNEYRLVRSAP
jgi:hypothetical protein